MSRVSLATAVAGASSRDPVLAHLAELAGPLTWRPPDPDGHFGFLVRAIIRSQGGAQKAKEDAAADAMATSAGRAAE